MFTFFKHYGKMNLHILRINHAERTYYACSVSLYLSIGKRYVAIFERYMI